LAPKTEFSAEIIKFKKKNDELLIKLKRLSEEVDHRISRMPKNFKPETPLEELEKNLLNEFEYLDKMKAVYIKEKEFLESRISAYTGMEKVVQMEKNLKNAKLKQEELIKNKKELLKRVKKNEKTLTSNQHKKDEGEIKIEVRKGIIILLF
jgi:hypothetical protein